MGRASCPFLHSFRNCRPEPEQSPVFQSSLQKKANIWARSPIARKVSRLRSGGGGPLAQIVHMNAWLHGLHERRAVEAAPHLLVDEVVLHDAGDLGVTAGVQVAAAPLALLDQPPLRLQQVAGAVAPPQQLLGLSLPPQWQGALQSSTPPLHAHSRSLYAHLKEHAHLIDTDWNWTA